MYLESYENVAFAAYQQISGGRDELKNYHHHHHQQQQQEQELGDDNVRTRSAATAHDGNVPAAADTQV